MDSQEGQQIADPTRANDFAACCACRHAGPRMAFKYTESSGRTTNGLQNGLPIPGQPDIQRLRLFLMRGQFFPRIIKGFF